MRKLKKSPNSKCEGHAESTQSSRESQVRVDRTEIILLVPLGEFDYANGGNWCLNNKKMRWHEFKKYDVISARVSADFDSENSKEIPKVS